MLTSHAITRVRARLAGSSSPVLVETDAGLFVAKLRGAGQGVAALIAELIVAELATSLGLPVAERSLLTLGDDVESLDKNDELAQLLGYSVGLNLGVRYLDGAKPPTPRALHELDDDFVARVLWLDGLTQNPDRTAKNPNVLLWHGRPWLIDHGAALTFQYAPSGVTEDSPRESSDYSDHVFGARAALLARYDAELTALIGDPALRRATAAVPDAFLTDVAIDSTPEKSRAFYRAFLWKRLKPPRPFIAPA